MNRQKSRNKERVCVRRLPNIEDFDRAVGNRSGGQYRSFRVSNDLTCLGYKHAPRVCEFRGLMIVLKEPKADVMFKLKNLLTERRLAHIKPVCGAREME